MRTLSINRSKLVDTEKLKCDDLYDNIMNYKEVNGTLPLCIMLYSSRIPEKCRESMSLTVDDTIIPIVELSEHPC